MPRAGPADLEHTSHLGPALLATPSRRGDRRRGGRDYDADDHDNPRHPLRDGAAAGCTEDDSRVGSLQGFVRSIGIAGDFGAGKFPVQEVQKIAVLDIRCMNNDRHDANILVAMDSRHDSFALTPIDHGNIFPDCLGVCSYEWVWMEWPQVQQPITDASLAAIERFDPVADAAVLARLAIRPPCLAVAHLSTKMLKLGATLGLTLHEIAQMISREDDDTPAPVEQLYIQALHLARARRKPRQLSEALPPRQRSESQGSSPLPAVADGREGTSLSRLNSMPNLSSLPGSAATRDGRWAQLLDDDKAASPGAAPQPIIDAPAIVGGDDGPTTYDSDGSSCSSEDLSPSDDDSSSSDDEDSALGSAHWLIRRAHRISFFEPPQGGDGANSSSRKTSGRIIGGVYEAGMQTAASSEPKSSGTAVSDRGGALGRSQSSLPGGESAARIDPAQRKSERRRGRGRGRAVGSPRRVLGERLLTRSASLWAVGLQDRDVCHDSLFFACFDEVARDEVVRVLRRRIQSTRLASTDEQQGVGTPVSN